MHPYRNFLLMILAASVLMFSLMYLNTYQLGHVWFSQTRMFMTFIMAGSREIGCLPFSSVGDVLGGPRWAAWPGGKAEFTASIPA